MIYDLIGLIVVVALIGWLFWGAARDDVVVTCW